MYYIGIDIGGTGVKAGIVDENGHILVKDSIKTGAERPYQEVVRDIADLCNSIIEKMHLSLEQIESIGVGVPGILDQRTGVIPFCTNLGWHEVPFIADMHMYFPGVPVYVDNDATVAGLAESVAGVSAGTQSSVFLTLGTGVGGGIVMNGRPYSGSHGVGSEIGHMVIRMDGEPCTCGKRGCFERYASATAIIREARKAVADHPESMIMNLCNNDPENITAKTVFDAAKENDPVAVKLFNNYVKSLAHGIVNIINIIDPEIIVLGGGVSNAGDFLLDAVREAVKPFIFYKTQPFATILLAQLGADAGIIGAAMLGKH